MRQESVKVKIPGDKLFGEFGIGDNLFPGTCFRSVFHLELTWRKAFQFNNSIKL